MMEKIKEEITGGEILTKDSPSMYALFDFPREGERTRKKKETDYRDFLKIPFIVTVTEILEPAYDKDGKPKNGEFKGSVYCEAKFPFEHGLSSGFIAVRCHADTVSEAQGNIIQEIGNRLFQASIASLRRD